MERKLSELFSDSTELKKIHETYEIDEKKFEKYLVKSFGECDIFVELFMTDEQRFMNFSYEVDVIYKCARCLTGVKKHLKESFSVEILEEGNKFGEDIGVLIVKDGVIDFEDIILKSLYINLETSVLCKEDCKGLCPKCGKDLNDSDCDCDLHEVDPRFAKLLDLKEKLDQ